MQSVLKVKGKWTVQAVQQDSRIEHRFNSPKLIVASGLRSIPNMPSFPGREDFHGEIIHQNDFGTSNILASPDVQNIVILGAGKSSADMAYEAVKAGKTVSWVLKATNTTGPGYFVSPKGKGPYKNAFEIGTTRLAGTFSPSFMGGVNLWARLLHSSKYGVKMMNGFWDTVDQEARKEANFERENQQGFEKLAPHSS